MEKIDVLLVEDDENIRALYSDALSLAKIRVRAVATASEGVSVALTDHPKVILMDIMLPDKSGHEAVHEIRKDRWGKTATIIYLTNRTDASDIVDAVEHNGEDYIIKAHIDMHELVNRVRVALHTR